MMWPFSILMAFHLITVFDENKNKRKNKHSNCCACPHWMSIKLKWIITSQYRFCIIRIFLLRKSVTVDDFIIIQYIVVMSIIVEIIKTKIYKCKTIDPNRYKNDSIRKQFSIRKKLCKRSYFSFYERWLLAFKVLTSTYMRNWCIKFTWNTRINWFFRKKINE